VTRLDDDFEPAPALNYVPRILVVDLSGDDGVALQQLAVVMKQPIPAVVHELIRRAMPRQNGHVGYKNTCSSCGKEYAAIRRAIPGKRSYCSDCRATGEPAADRARDYRERKAKERQ